MMKSEISLWAAVILVVGIFSMSAVAGSEWGGSNPGELYYNLLVRGFQDGQLSLKKEVPAGLAALSDPYDPVANAPYRSEPYGLHDMSYFRGRLYLYFGISPALLLFWPWVAVTGHFLAHKYAVAIFCSTGFLSGALLMRAAWRRYFPGVGAGVAAASALALGLATAVVLMLQRPGVCEVAVGCAYALCALALVAVWRSIHDPARGARWLAAASLFYGLALGARPSELFGAVILLVPAVLATGKEGRTRLLAAAAIPVVACGLGLMLYNEVRFGNPFEFGEHYQLANDRQGILRHFSLGYLPFNFRLYFLTPVIWSSHFPFVLGVRVPPIPQGMINPENVAGILPNIPVTALALAAPLAWRGLEGEARRRLRGFVIGLALFCAFSALPILLFYCACTRYEAEFLPALMLLAVIGIFGIERSLSGLPRWRGAVRCGWILLLAFSVAFNLCASVGRYAGERMTEGQALARSGRWADAIPPFESAARFDPGSALVHFELGSALDAAGRLEPAVTEYRASLRIDPGVPETHNHLGIALARLKRLPEAAEELAETLKLAPDDLDARANLGNVFFLMGRLPEAVAAYEAVLRLRPGDAQVRRHLELVKSYLGSGRQL